MQQFETLSGFKKHLVTKHIPLQRIADDLEENNVFKGERAQKELREHFDATEDLGDDAADDTCKEETCYEEQGYHISAQLLCSLQN